MNINFFIMNRNNLVIFDLDGTLYDLGDVVKSNYEMQVNFLCLKKELTKTEATSFFYENHIYPVMKEDSLSATELFLKMGLSKKEWSEYRNTNFRVEKIDISKAVHANLLREFSELATIVLLSSNAYDVIEKILNHISIPISIFEEIVCSDNFPINVPFKKSLAMMHLSNKYTVDYQFMYSIGDRYSTDIKPMVDLGGRGILLRNPRNLTRVLRDMENDQLSSCDEYDYF